MTSWEKRPKHVADRRPRRKKAPPPKDINTHSLQKEKGERIALLFNKH
jgi:hypothetical protein